GVRSTGIYCRPSCPARLPRRRNVRLFRTAAAAQSEGFRACKRCEPDAAPGSPAWNRRADVAGRAVRLVADGVVDREGVPGLASRLGFAEIALAAGFGSVRQFNDTVGAVYARTPTELRRRARRRRGATSPGAIELRL